MSWRVGLLGVRDDKAASDLDGSPVVTVADGDLSSVV